MSILITAAVVVFSLLALWVGPLRVSGQPARLEAPVPRTKLNSKTFYTKIAGVTKKNSDGERRQSIIKQLDAGERVTLIREPDNRYDPNAIRVECDLGQIGYIPAETALNNLASEMDRGCEVTAIISDITGGEPGKPTRGVNLEITVASVAQTSASEVCGSSWKEPPIVATGAIYACGIENRGPQNRGSALRLLISSSLSDWSAR